MTWAKSLNNSGYAVMMISITVDMLIYAEKPVDMHNGGYAKIGIKCFSQILHVAHGRRPHYLISSKKFGKFPAVFVLVAFYEGR